MSGSTKSTTDVKELEEQVRVLRHDLSEATRLLKEFAEERRQRLEGLCTMKLTSSSARPGMRPKERKNERLRRVAPSKTTSRRNHSNLPLLPS